MHVDTTAVDRYLAEGTLADTWLVRAAAGDGAEPVAPVLPPADDRARVRALRDHLAALLEPFTPAHPDAWAAVAEDWPALVTDARVALVVGWPQPYDAGVRTAPDGGEVVVVDVARVAAYGHDAGLAAARAVLDHEVAHVLVARRWPPRDAAGFRDLLDRLTFDEGLAHYLGLRGHAAFDPSSAARAGRVRAAHDALRAARDLTSDPEQRDTLRRGVAADDFWNKFACVAGALAFADAEADGGPAALGALARAGWEGFVDRVLAAPRAGSTRPPSAGAADPSRAPGPRE